MRVGMIFECGPDGADVKVCKHLVRMLDPNIEVVPVTLTNKRQLVTGCSVAAAQLLKGGCDRVVIVWDLSPSWERDRTPCRKTDCESIKAALDTAGAAMDKVHLGCIEQELEAWLIADGRAVSAFLSRPSRLVRVRDANNPEQIPNPKGWLDGKFRAAGQRGGYRDLQHAERLATQLPDLNRVRKCTTFVRFALKVADKQL